MNKKNPLVCILILNWNGGEVTKQCVESLKKTSYKNYKTILIDNGSKNKKEVEELKKVNEDLEIIYLGKNYGYTIGINAGYKYVLKIYDPDYICEMNNDIITIQKEWLDIQVEELEKKQEYGISGNKLVFPDGKVQIVSKKSEACYFEKDKGQFDYVESVPYVRGGCLLVKKEVVRKIGYPDENFFFGPSDIDYCYRAIKAGYKVIYNGFSKSIHLAGYSSLRHEKDWIFFPQTKGMLIFYLRYKGLAKGLLISSRFLVRAFISRRIPHTPLTLKNLKFHKTAIKRTYFFLKALLHALKSYSKIKNDSNKKILKI